MVNKGEPMAIPDYQSIMLPLLKLLSKGAFQKRGSRSKKQQWQRINEEGVSLRGAQATKQSRSKRLLRSARNDTFSSLGCRHHLGEYLFSGMHPPNTSECSWYDPTIRGNGRAWVIPGNAGGHNFG